MRKAAIGVAAAAVLVVIGGSLTPLLLLSAILGSAPAAAAAVDCSTGVPLPTAAPASSRTTVLTAGQTRIVQAIISEGEQVKRIPARGIVIALAVARQESGWLNYANDGAGQLGADQRGVVGSLLLPHDAIGHDHGSVNAFQQQYPWWGTLTDLMTPTIAAGKFYDALVKVRGWQQLPLTVAAQRVQRSAFPDAYADDENPARAVYAAFTGAPLPPISGPRCAAAPATSPGNLSSDGWSLPVAAGRYTLSSGYGARPNPTGPGRDFHTGLDFAAPIGTPIVAATAGTVTFAGVMNGYGNLLVLTRGATEIYYAHQAPQGFTVATGRKVTAGQRIGTVGATGRVNGPHLHFEIRTDGHSIDPLPVLRSHGLDPGRLP